MAGRKTFLFAIASSLLLCFARCEYEWSGFVNAFQDPVDFLCPDNLALVGLASDFRSAPIYDRRWEFQCASGGGLANVSSTCTLQTFINNLQEDIDYTCPGESYLAGLQSEFDPPQDDRTWQAYCCERPYATLINCEIPTVSWENVLRDNLNYSFPMGYVVAGLQSFYFNRDRRWRFRSCQIEVSCGDPGVPDNAVRQGNNFLYQDEVVFTCNNGYYQSSGPEGGRRVCLETGLWSDTQPECSLCTDIDNCADIRCSNSSDQQCFVCESDYGAGLGEAAYSNLITECQPLCSWMGSFCYPGICPGIPDSCNCSLGFEGPDCLEITDTPDIESCSTFLRGSTGQEVQSNCPTNTSFYSPVFTNFVPTELEGMWTSVYLPPSPRPPTPAYVTGFDVGVAVSEIQATIYRAANPTQQVTMTTHNCTGSVFSPDAPSVTITMCTAMASVTELSAHAFLHGDRFTLEVYVYNGGYLDVRDLDTGATTRHYYTGSSAVGTAVFTLDLEAPTHCSLVDSTLCLPSQSILDLGVEVTESNSITASWGGWEDDPSGVVSYTLDVFNLVETDDILREGNRVTFSSFQHTGQASYEDVVNLPNEGPYSFVLLTFDVAGNIHYSRRLVLFDATSSLNVDQSAPLQVTSAVPETGFLWQNSTSDPLIISGQGHFYNTNLRTNNYLAPVANYSAGVDPEFDHPLDSGRYPREGTVNALGVTRLFYEVVVDHEGGLSSASVTQPVIFTLETTDVGIEELVVSASVEDGDSVRVWFMAVDFKFQEQIDSVVVHVDSSAPMLRDLWLEYRGETGLSLHGTDSLLDLSIQFSTSDEHSGIAMVEWRIGTEPGASDVGYGNLPVQTENMVDCIAPECVCDPLERCSRVDYEFSPPDSAFPSSLARHDTDYYITIIVTNHALLSSSLTHQITVDTTPALTGVVFDAPSGLPDIDYQQSLTLAVWWAGFFDRETDIAFYQYIIDTKCANESSFSFPLEPGSPVGVTTDSVLSWNAPDQSTYYTTVVAYNNALQPSPPVCSDGVTVDMETPYFEGVSISGAVIEPGLAGGPDGEVWLILSNREREFVGVGEDVEECANRSSPISSEELSKYPISLSPGEEFDVSRCSQFGSFSPSLIYLISDVSIKTVSWDVRDNVGVYEYLVGIIGAEEYSEDPNSISYKSSAGHAHYSIYSPEILTNGNRFYLSVIARDLAGLETRLDVGPVVVDITLPLVNGSIQVERNGDRVIVAWDEGTFTDPEDGDGVLVYDYAIGRSGFEAVDLFVIEQDDLDDPDLNSCCPSPICFKIDPILLGLISGQQYHITLRATNNAGLSSAVTSDPYVHVSGPPSQGVVLDIDPSVGTDSGLTGVALLEADVDLLVDVNEVAAIWRGFDHAHLEVTFRVGLGTQPGLDDVIDFVSVNQQTSYTFTNLTLPEQFPRYYITVIAENDYGNVSVSSDGVLLVHSIEAMLQDAIVYDGGEEEDIDYQHWTSFAAARWTFPRLISTRTIVSYHQWAIYRVANDSENFDSSMGDLIKPFESVGADFLAAASGLDLQVGEKYVAAVQACHFTACLPPVYSDGFLVSSPPVSASVTATYEPLLFDEEFGSSSSGLLRLSWVPFTDPQIAYYEWALGTGEPGYELLEYWNQVDWFQNEVSVVISATISLHTTNTVTLRGYNLAGLHSETSTQLEWISNGQTLPQDSVPRLDLVIFDIPESQVPELTTADWRDLEYREWDLTDIQYSSSPSSLSAAWPDLRYMSYEYSVSRIQQFSCSSTDSLRCGDTIANAVTVSNLSLEDGEQYYICVKAIRANAIHVTSATPGTLMACTNGITVDLSPPIGGCVQIVPPALIREAEIAIDVDDPPSGFIPMFDTAVQCESDGPRFQLSTSEIHIVWDQFSDVEQYGNQVHTTGVASYQYSIGTSPGGDDVVGLTSVGVSTQVIVRNLVLQAQHTYYATVRAYDFTGQWSESYSPGVTVDPSPPRIGDMWIEGGSEYTTTGLVLNWTPIGDPESGVASFECGLGSRPGITDIKTWVPGDGNAISGMTLEPGTLSRANDGDLVFLTIKATNAAGLTSVATSRGYHLDSSPPEPGTVYDGQLPPDPSEEGYELDYSSSLTTLSAWWRGFSDPHSGISYYYWAIGTCSGCWDVQNFQSVGVASGTTRTGLLLQHGQKYYITVRACNLIGLCSSTSSNGITIDTTPPIPGKLNDGYISSEGDIQYQACRLFVSAHWSRFHDAESSLRNYVVYVGLQPNDSSIIPPTFLLPDSSSFLLPTPFPLPTNRVVYVTLVAYNHIGASTQVSSSGVYIDDTPPELQGTVSIDTWWAGSVSGDTQYATSALRVEWDFTDSFAPVDRHFWTLLHRVGTSTPLSAMTSGTQMSDSVSTVGLSDGETYSVLAIGCNAASLCLQSESDDVLFDSSPPIDGYFAVETTSAIELYRTVPGGMTWRNRVVRNIAEFNLAFVGFSDPHSQISEYWSTVGSNFTLSDLSEGGAVLLEPSVASDNGTLIASIRLNRLVDPSEVVYISLWAVNGVGLRSHTVQGSFRIDTVPGVTNNGSLTLLRSSTCPIESCTGHCTCAARGDLCEVDSSLMATCQELDSLSLSPDMQVSVSIVTPQLTPGANSSVLYTAVTDKLTGTWEMVDPSSDAIWWLEWTVGIEGLPPGTGLIDTTNDPIWRVAGLDTTAVFTPSPAYPLQHGVTYVFHIRAWYSDVEYSVFTSDGVTVDTRGPEIVRGWRVREVGEQDRQVDADYISSSSEVQVAWQGVFTGTLSGNLSTYEVALGDSPGSDNECAFTLIPTASASTVLTGLALRSGRKYYTTVRATSPLGVIRDSISDGFTVSLLPPNRGTVVDGLRYYDVQGQQSNDTFSARWFGFNDPQSGIHHYELAIVDSTDPPPPESSYEDVGIGLKTTRTSQTLLPGRTYLAYVAAVNAAGLRSDAATSSGVTIDDSRPIGQVMNCVFTELLTNPSFEGVSNIPDTCGTVAPDLVGWSTAILSGMLKILHASPTFSPYHGCVSLSFTGLLFQSFATTPGADYKLSLAIKGQGDIAEFQAILRAPGIVESLHNSMCNEGGWQRFEFWFTATEDESSISIFSSYGIIVDAFSVTQCSTTPIVLTLNYTDIGQLIAVTIGLAQADSGGGGTRIIANWDIFDLESVVRDYQWAIGTVAGGEQLQRYTSTGNRNRGISNRLDLSACSEIFVSVVAWNYAGLETVAYSGPFIVDVTPPELNGTVIDGTLLTGDLDYQSFTIVAADWSAVVDPESGITECRWAIGTSPGESDVQGYKILTFSNGSSADLTTLLHGTTVYSTVVCLNGVGHFSTFYSNGVTILLDAPRHTGAFAFVSSPLLTKYAPRDGYVPTDELLLRWGGFTETADSPLSYEVRVTESLSGTTGPWNDVGLAKMLTLSQLNLTENVTHVIEVRAVSSAQVPSASLMREFTIVTDPPTDTGALINSSWTSANTLQLEWTGRFSSPAPLYYEFSLGTQFGSGSIRQWVELSTDRTVVQIFDVRLSSVMDYFLSLTAIASTGLHRTVDHLIAGIPMSG